MTQLPRGFSMTAAAVTVGVDLGGTGTRIVSIDAGGTIRYQNSVATPRETGSTISSVTTLIDHIAEAAQGSTLVGVGVGASGPVDINGIIRNDDTLRAFSHIPLVDMITGTLNVPCVIDNDAVAAAIGENTYGAGRHSPALLMITLGTGIGVAAISHNTPFRGADGTHPEAGHIPVPGPPAPCYCGLPICWEQLASRTALDAATEHRTSGLANSADRGDQSALQLFDSYGEHVGVGASVLMTIFRPACVVIGGSAAQFLSLFATGFDRALSRSKSFAWTPPYREAELGAISGAIGAAVLARPEAADV
jgi:glucokinase